MPIVAIVADASPIQAAEAAIQVAALDPVSMTPAFISGVDAPHGWLGMCDSLHHFNLLPW
jgi:hypothetical protein